MLRLSSTIGVCCLLGTLSACQPDLPPAERPISTLDATALTGDAIAGKGLFQEECGKCHRLVKGKNHKGPQLNRIYGAKAATLADYTRYSEALKQSDIVWDAAGLDAYIASPKKRIPNSRMLYDGLADAKQRQDIIAYLATLR